MMAPQQAAVALITGAASIGGARPVYVVVIGLVQVLAVAVEEEEEEEKDSTASLKDNGP
jgi:hypothetical protein